MYVDAIPESLELIAFLGKNKGRFSNIRSYRRQFKLLTNINLSYDDLSGCIENLIDLKLIRIRKDNLYLAPAGYSIYKMIK